MRLRGTFKLTSSSFKKLAVNTIKNIKKKTQYQHNKFFDGYVLWFHGTTKTKYNGKVDIEI